jgi:hypothetical protein
VRYDLVAEEIEIYPMRGAPALGTSEGGSVEEAGNVEIVDWEGDVERRKRQGIALQDSLLY